MAELMMTNQEFEERLMHQLRVLEELEAKILKTSGYIQDVQHIRALSELIREQLKRDNTLHTASALR